MRELGNILECGKNNATYVLGANRIGMVYIIKTFYDYAALSGDDNYRIKACEMVDL